LKSIALPTLILHGTDDLIADTQASEEFSNLISSEDKTLKLYQGMYHDILHEIGKEKVYDDIITWLYAHL
jgi:alpha-beta hydrolase superfamily lysophospholipase